MFLNKFLCFVIVLNSAKSCVVNTFHNTSVIVGGVRKPITKIDGCFGPEQNVENVVLIQILNENIPTLYEDAFNNLNLLLDIVLENDGINEIRPGAFKNLPKLYLIRLKHNNIKIIPEGVFNNLPISELSLVSNNIETIHSRAFDDLPNLKIVLLGDNKLVTWDPNWFTGSHNLNLLNLENNLITRLPAKSFKNIRGVHVVNKLNVSTSIHLNNNKIKEIDEGALDGPNTLGWLFLHRNEINDINSNSVGNLMQVDWLRLDHNRLECIPEKLLEIAPNVIYYLDGNPLTEECIRKYDIKIKSNGSHLNKFNISIN